VRIIESFEGFLKIQEMGGWATTKTQGTKITPALLKEAVDVLNNIFEKFNKYAASLGMAPLKVLGPGGSGVYYKEDLIENPDKAYGDVDILVEYPLDEPQSRRVEIDTMKEYNQLMLKWMKENRQPEIDEEESDAISDGSLKLVINLTDGSVQVDIIPTFTYSAEWAKARYTPIRGMKGFVMGFLYQAFGNALGVSVTDRGVVAKIKGGELVGPNMRKDVEEKIITRDFSKFILQLAEFVDEFAGTKRELVIDEYLNEHPGIDVSKLSLEQICDGILAFARTLEKTGTYDLPNFKYNSSKDFLEEVVKIYAQKLEKHRTSSKYDKALTDLANQQKDKVMHDAETAFEYVSNKLLNGTNI
jgi:hypothetical protein